LPIPRCGRTTLASTLERRYNWRNEREPGVCEVGSAPGAHKGDRMSYQERKMYDVSHMGLRCAECSAEIRELPFEPKDDRPVYCKDCARKRRPPRSGGGGPRR